MQKTLEDVIIEINKSIVEININNNMITPFICDTIMFKTGSSLKRKYQKFPDGLHPGTQAYQEWGKILANGIDTNFSRSVGEDGACKLDFPHQNPNPSPSGGTLLLPRWQEEEALEDLLSAAKFRVLSQNPWACEGSFRGEPMSEEGLLLGGVHLQRDLATGSPPFFSSSGNHTGPLDGFTPGRRRASSSAGVLRERPLVGHPPLDTTQNTLSP